ncbi:hypothetical protein QOT17_019927 [Balamuthia mandrillaris]
MHCLSFYQGHHLLSFLGEWPFLLVCTHMQLHNAGLVETLQTLLREGKKPGNTLLATFYRGLIPGALSKALYCLCFSYLHRTLFRLVNHRRKRAVPLYKKYLSLNALKQFLHLEKEAEFRFHLQRRQKMDTVPLSQDDVLQRAKRFAAFALCYLLFRPVSDMTQNFDVLLLAQQQLSHSASSSSSSSSASPSSSLDSNERREKIGRTNLRLSAKKNASGLLRNAKIVLYNVVISAVASFVSYPFLTLATRAIAPNEAAQQPLISPKTITKWTTGLQMLKMFLMMIAQRQITLSQAKDMFYMSLEQQQKQKRATPSASPSPLLALVKKLYSGFLPRLFYTLLQSGFDAIMALMLLSVASKIYDVIQHQRHEEKDEKDEEERVKRRRIFYQFIRAIFIGCIVKHVVAYPFNVISTRKRLLNMKASASLFSLFRGWMFIAVVKYFFVLLVRPKVEQKWMLLWSHQQADDEKEVKEEKGKEKKHDDDAEETLDEGQDYVGEEEYEDLGSWLL